MTELAGLSGFCFWDGVASPARGTGLYGLREVSRRLRYGFYWESAAS